MRCHSGSCRRMVRITYGGPPDSPEKSNATFSSLRLDGRLTASIDPPRLGVGDPLKLALFPQVGLELGEHSQHVEEALARCCAGVDGLLSGLEAGALCLHGSDDILKGAGASGEAGGPRPPSPV